MQSDYDRTPRPSKRFRVLNESSDIPALSPSSTSEASSVSGVGSHKSGRASPIKQLLVLEDFAENPVVFKNFNDHPATDFTSIDVIQMRVAAQSFGDGVGILGWSNEERDTTEVSVFELERFAYKWARDSVGRRELGSTPPLARVETIVLAARRHDRGGGLSEDEWNCNVHQPLLDLARSTSKHQQTLSVVSVKNARIEPTSLARTALPSRVVDYVIALEPDAVLDEAWSRLSLLHGMASKSWNHTSRARTTPFAIHIETKAPNKSWTDGKPKIAIWTDALLNRLSLLQFTPAKPSTCPAIPILIAQGHEWHLLIFKKSKGKTVVWEQVTIGNTRTCFDTLKIIAALHWLMDWAERVWRPWIHSLVAGDPTYVSSGEETPPSERSNSWFAWDKIPHAVSLRDVWRDEG